MKLFDISSLILWAQLASASSFFQQLAGDQQNLQPWENRPVPGESPLLYCSDTEKDILTINSVNLSPNPPIPGRKLSIKAEGVLHDVIYKGAYIQLTVRYGLITLVRERLDLCDHVDQVDLECPIDEGELKLYKEVDIPGAVPPGHYNVVANVTTVDDRSVTCLTALVDLP